MTFRNKKTIKMNISLYDFLYSSQSGFRFANQLDYQNQ